MQFSLDSVYQKVLKLVLFFAKLFKYKVEGVFETQCIYREYVFCFISLYELYLVSDKNANFAQRFLVSAGEINILFGNALFEFKNSFLFSLLSLPMK